MINRQCLLDAERRLALQKRAFVASGAPPQGDPSPMGGAPPVGAPSQMGAPPAPPMDPSAAGGQPPPSAPAAPPPGDPSQAPPPGDPAAAGPQGGGASMAPPPPSPGGQDPQMIEQAVMRAMQNLQAQQEGGKGGKSKKVDPAQILVENQINRKLLTNLHSAMGIPLPYSILEGDVPDPNSDQQAAGGGGGGGSSGDSGGGEKQEVTKGAVQSIKPIQPAFDQTKQASVPIVERASGLLMQLRQRKLR